MIEQQIKQKMTANVRCNRSQYDRLSKYIENIAMLTACGPSFVWRACLLCLMDVQAQILLVIRAFIFSIFLALKRYFVFGFSLLHCSFVFCQARQSDQFGFSPQNTLHTPSSAKPSQQHRAPPFYFAPFVVYFCFLPFVASMSGVSSRAKQCLSLTLGSSSTPAPPVPSAFRDFSSPAPASHYSTKPLKMSPVNSSSSSPSSASAPSAYAAMIKSSSSPSYSQQAYTNNHPFMQADEGIRTSTYSQHSFSSHSSISSSSLSSSTSPPPSTSIKIGSSADGCAEQSGFGGTDAEATVEIAGGGSRWRATSFFLGIFGRSAEGHDEKEEDDTAAAASEAEEGHVQSGMKEEVVGVKNFVIFAVDEEEEEGEFVFAEEEEEE